MPALRAFPATLPLRAPPSLRTRPGLRLGPHRGRPCTASADSAGAARKHPNSQWDTGVPPRMGEHVMPSGVKAPLSTSTGVGTGPPHLFQYTNQEAPVTVEVYSTPDALSAGAAALFVSVVRAAVARKGSAVVALSGGSLPRRLAGVAAAAPGLDWSALHVFLADERLVPPSDPECSALALRKAFLDTLPGFPAANLHQVAFTPGVSPADAAAQYEAVIVGMSQAALPRTGAGMPVFDLILLGIGPDGHTASLFPNRSTLVPTTRVVLPVTESPKPPPQRVTLSLSCINAAAAVAFVADGASKAEVLHRILEVQALPGALPAQMVRATQPGAEVKWLLDSAAASALHPQEWANPDKFPRSEVPKK